MDEQYIKEMVARLDKETLEIEQEAIRDETRARLIEYAKSYTGDDEIISFKELEEELKNEPPVKKMSSNISGLDMLLEGGFMTQTVTSLSATPKSGKTSFCMYLTSLMAQYNPLWFALEESSKSLIRKMIKNGVTIPNGYTPKRNINVNLDWIETKIFESCVKNKTKIVFIDQLDFIVPQDGQGDRHDLKIASTMRRLHQIAVKLDVAIFLICHLEKMEPETKPTIKNFRGSSSIWGESDNCILLWRECKKEHGELEYTNNVLVSLQANREDGNTGNIKMVFESGKFRQEDWLSSEENVRKDFKEF